MQRMHPLSCPYAPRSNLAPISIQSAEPHAGAVQLASRFTSREVAESTWARYEEFVGCGSPDSAASKQNNSKTKTRKVHSVECRSPAGAKLSLVAPTGQGVDYEVKRGVSGQSMAA